MAVPLTINGTTYEYPEQNDEIWAIDATGWAQAVSIELNKLVVTGDIGQDTLVTINNNQVTPTNVNNLAFDSATVRAAFISYYVYRSWNGGLTEVVEAGTIYACFKDTANEWTLTQVGQNTESSGVQFDITAGGQITYISDNKTPNTSYSGTCKFRASVLTKI
jgi:hypothetical protein